MFFKKAHVNNPKYRKSFKGAQCIVKGCMDRETVVGAHIREHSYAGMGRKPSDSLILPLCRKHHVEQSRDRDFWCRELGVDTIEEVKEIAESRYNTWAGIE